MPETLYWVVVPEEGQEEASEPHVVTERAQVKGGHLYRLLYYDYTGRLFSVGGLAFVPE